MSVVSKFRWWRHPGRCIKKVLLIITIVSLITLVSRIFFYIYPKFNYLEPKVNPKSLSTTKSVIKSTKEEESIKRIVIKNDQDYQFTKDEEYFNWIKNQVIIAQRETIEYEMKGYKFLGNASLNSLVMEKDGKPVRNLIFATWRSGSTFLGDLLNSHPGMFYHYEPFLHMKVKQMKTKEENEYALKRLNNLLSCNYSDQIEEFRQFPFENQERNFYNKRVLRFCVHQRKICEDAQFIGEMCKLFPFQTVKSVRLRLSLGRALLDNKMLSVRLLLLIRDPRAIIRSRRNSDWCSKGADCYDPEILCTDMEDDWKHAEELRRKFPGRFLALRYEDISLHPFTAAKKILKFFRLQFHPSVNDFVKTHTVTNFGGSTSTYRDSKQTPFKWKQEFSLGNFSILNVIQKRCSKVLKSWGYAPVLNVSQLKTLNTLLKPPWPEMMVV